MEYSLLCNVFPNSLSVLLVTRKQVVARLAYCLFSRNPSLAVAKSICLQRASCQKALDLKNLFTCYWGTYIKMTCPRLMTRNKAHVSKLASFSALQIFSYGMSAKDT